MSYQRPAESWVLEGVMTSLSPQGELNVAPMGPIVDASVQTLVLRPFQTSTTYRNIKATGQSVFHVSDDALLIARGAIGTIDIKSLPTRPAEHVRGVVLAEACRYYELQVAELDDRDPRTTILMRVVHAGRLRDFFGFNRARHAVLEAAILATRLHLTGREPVLKEMERFQEMVEKTGSAREHQAMQELRKFILRHPPGAP